MQMRYELAQLLASDYPLIGRPCRLARRIFLRVHLLAWPLLLFMSI